MAFLAFLAACTPDVAPPVAVDRSTTTMPPAITAPIRTDRAAYRFTEGAQGPELTIVATFRAPADRAASIVNCNGASSTGLQRKAGETWIDAWTIAINGCLSPPIVVPPGGEHTARIFVHERSGAVLYPRGRGLLESGTYRVVWHGVLASFDASARPFGAELPLEERVSAPFTIEGPAAQQ